MGIAGRQREASRGGGTLTFGRSFLLNFSTSRDPKRCLEIISYPIPVSSIICHSGGSPRLGGLENQIPEIVLREEHGKELGEVEAGCEQGTV